MASVCNDPGGLRRVQFCDKAGVRKSIRLGKVSNRDAESIKCRVESLLSSAITGAVDRDTSLWVAFITDKNPRLRLKLESVGLLEPILRAVQVSMSTNVTDFIKRAGETRKPGTVAVWKQVERELLRHMPQGIALNEVTKGHAKAFHEALKKRELASLTVIKHVRIAKQIFEDACEWNKIPSNPFAGIKLAASIPRNNVEVPRAVIDQLMPHLDTTWQTIIALCRYGGLRCPSEVLSLKWSDIDWDKNRMAIPEPKVEHHEGRGVRICPIFPELLKHLDAAWDVARGKAVFVVGLDSYRLAANTGTGWKNANLRTQLIKRLKKAGLSPWARLFHSMRASRQTELEREHPIHVVCNWLGNSPRVAQRSYLLTTDSDFEKAINGGVVKSGAVDPENVVKTSAVGVGSSRQESEVDEPKTRVNIKNPVISLVKSTDGEGFEPTVAFRLLRFSRPVH